MSASAAVNRLAAAAAGGGRRRGAVSHSVAQAIDIRDGLALMLSSAAAAFGAAAAASAAVVVPAARLAQRRNALVGVNPRALRLALNLPSPACASSKTFSFARADSECSKSNSNSGSCSQSASPSSSRGSGGESDRDAGLSAAAAASLPASRAALPRRPAVSFPSASAWLAQLGLARSSSEEGHIQDGESAAREGEPDLAASPLGSTSPMSPLARFVAHSLGAPAMRRSSPPLEHAAAAAQPAVMRNARRRAAVVAHVDFMGQIPEDWRDPALARPQPVQSPRIRQQRRSSVSNAVAARNHRNVFLSVALTPERDHRGGGSPCSDEGRLDAVMLTPFMSPSLQSRDESYAASPQASIFAARRSSLPSAFGSMSPGAGELRFLRRRSFVASASPPLVFDDLDHSHSVSTQDREERKSPERMHSLSVSQPGGFVFAARR